ncbi:hypothetical protein [Pleurocapsa sp. FMAR1]|uniref:hypothetical protein n=1 Tax=Pleurocapsa sp. FMAR1 TaxID=3040204 RepID=UPI0029C68B20|nr:hypothetical protein [Pleurocapsa sp. FMAR1]
MTELLKQAIAKLENLSDNEQDNIAAIILEELEDEQKRKNTYSSDNLADLIQERFAQLGGIDNLLIASREAMREPPEFE